MSDMNFKSMFFNMLEVELYCEEIENKIDALLHRWYTANGERFERIRNKFMIILII